MTRIQNILSMLLPKPPNADGSLRALMLEAFLRGAAWNPAYPELQNLDEDRISKMTGYEPDAQLLIKSLQESDANIDILGEAFHGRPVNPDGVVGPATQALVGMRRCPMPDFIPPAGARFRYADPGLQRAVETMQENALAGSGSWPSCDPEQEGVHSLRVRIDTTRIPSVVRSYFIKSLEAVVAAYREIGCGLRYIDAGSGDCEILKRFESLSGSVIGWNEFPTPNTCNQTINGRLDTGYTPGNWLYWANLECHETGHGVGLQHTRGSIMNPSILLVDPLTWIGSPSYPTLKRYFGGEPIQPPAPPTPNPQPAELELTGTIEARVNGVSVGQFVLRPILER